MKKNREALVDASGEIGPKANAEKTKHEGHTESHEQHFFSFELGTADERE